MAGASIQRFQILAKLGEGGMGTVYRAHDPQLERDVAIKVLSAPDSDVRVELSTVRTIDLREDSPTSTHALLREARMMARLSHPNIVPVYEVGLDGTAVFVVMEHVDGEDLRHWLATSRTTPEILAVFAQAARGLEAAHAHGIVHRDFKPDNVLIGRDGRVRVVDFGLSRLVSTPPMMRVADRGGTPKYMAPELWDGAPATAAVDIYALCTALGEAFGCDLGGTHAELVRALAARMVPDPACEVIAAGRAKEPAERPSIDRVIAVLSRRSTRPRTVMVAAGALVMCAAGVAVALATTSSDGPACSDVPDLFADRWNPDVRAKLHAKLAPQITDELSTRLLASADARALEVGRAQRALCEAKARGTLTAAQATRRASCLERRAMELGAIVRTSIAATRVDAGDAQEKLLAITPVTCEELELPELGERAAVEALYLRFVATDPAAKEALAETAAIETAAAALGDAELEIRAGIRLGILQRNADQVAESLTTLERAHRRAVEIKSENQQAIALGERGQSTSKTGDVRAAKLFARLARDLVDKPAAPVGTRLRIYRYLGRAELLRGEYAAAIELLQSGLAMLANSDERHAQWEILTRMDLTDALLMIGGRQPEGLALALETAERATTLLGDRSDRTALALNQVGKAYQYGRDHARSLVYRRQALAIIASKLPPNHSEVLHQRAEVAQALHHLNEVDAARDELTQIVALAEGNPGVRSYLAYWQYRLALAICDTGNHDDGIPRLEAALDQMVSDQGAEHAMTLRRRFTLADQQIEAGHLAGAAKNIATLEQLYGKQPDAKKQLARVHGELAARLSLLRGRAREAEATARLAIAAMAEVGTSKPQRTTTMVNLGTSLVEQGRFAEARTELENARAILLAEPTSEDAMALVELGLARAEYGLGLRDEALARSERVRAVLERYRGQALGRRRVAELLATATSAGR